ncbi:hypothetical protein [Streptacidiphilus jiangxiensis]|uniref:Uncharacterized protein n=1 Tax=Streptacidiphilus jiangxiensis TaxID=235985 RepID=A0A1H7H1L7_STRJI|nr:hypothetical protein [Streptacidiphilus jiangxiensis]SEK44313.1 hypothetical protein SAMN05414137_10244 [Streptacidiphilus jiangxiensis]
MISPTAFPAPLPSCGNPAETAKDLAGGDTSVPLPALSRLAGRGHILHLDAGETADTTATVVWVAPAPDGTSQLHIVEPAQALDALLPEVRDDAELAECRSILRAQLSRTPDAAATELGRLIHRATRELALYQNLDLGPGAREITDAHVRFGTSKASTANAWNSPKRPYILLDTEDEVEHLAPEHCIPLPALARAQGPGHRIYLDEGVPGTYGPTLLWGCERPAGGWYVELIVMSDIDQVLDNLRPADTAGPAAQEFHLLLETRRTAVRADATTALQHLADQASISASLYEALRKELSNPKAA